MGVPYPDTESSTKMIRAKIPRKKTDICVYTNVCIHKYIQIHLRFSLKRPRKDTSMQTSIQLAHEATLVQLNNLMNTSAKMYMHIYTQQPKHSHAKI
jgi:hypothetical protein